MVRPPMVIQHNCYVPEREGYHVIMAVWDVGDTAASFYNAIDVNFAGDNVITAPEPEVDAYAEIGLISGAIALEAGDTISTMVFDDNGEIPSLSVSYEADGYTSAVPLRWHSRAINDAASVTTPVSAMATCSSPLRARTNLFRYGHHERRDTR